MKYLQRMSDFLCVIGMTFIMYVWLHLMSLSFSILIVWLIASLPFISILLIRSIRQSLSYSLLQFALALTVLGYSFVIYSEDYIFKDPEVITNHWSLLTTPVLQCLIVGIAVVVYFMTVNPPK